MGKPFSRKKFLMEIIDYIEKGWGSYNELIQLSMLELRDIKVSIESRMQEEQLQRALNS